MWPFTRKPEKPDIVECINFNGQNVSTGAVGSYLVWLANHEDLHHLGFTYRKENDGSLRFVIYCLKYNQKAVRYFKDRCPAMVEDEVKKFRKPIYRFKFNTWANGFSEVVEDNSKEEK